MRTCIQKGIHIRRMEATSFEPPPISCRDVAGNAQRTMVYLAAVHR